MIAGEKDRVIAALIQTAHHAQGIAAPAPQHPGSLRELGGVQIAGRVVGVLDQDLVCAAGERAFTGGLDFHGHLLAEVVILVRSRPFGLAPVGDPAGTFDIGADEYVHGAIPPWHGGPRILFLLFRI